jgi:3-oxoacyl-(acyl-carrier-protein) synthase
VGTPVHILGVGVISAFGDSRESFRDALLSGSSAIAASAHFAAAGCRAVLAARVTGFDAARWIPPMKLRRMDETGAFALVAVRQAIDEARYNVDVEGDDDAGVVLGTCTAGGRATSEYLSALFEGGQQNAPALLFNSTVANAATGLAGLEFKLRGPNVTISQKEASGLAAVATAVDVIRDGRARAIAAGGADAIYDIYFRTHDRFGVINPARAAGCETAAFDRSRRGFVPGEGGVALWLEGGDAWRERGARSYGTVLGIGAASASVPLNAWPERPGPLIRTMTMALEDAGVQPADVGVVYASANGTALDSVEAEALGQLFGSARPVVTSIKSAIGEFGAAGSASCAAALLCGRAGKVPPIAGLVEVDPAVNGLRLSTRRQDAPGEIVLVNSFASGGALFSVVLRIEQ